MSVFSKRKKGLTLLELLAIIIIGGILIAVALGVYNKIIDKSELQSLDSQELEIENVVGSYFTKYKKVPTTNGTYNFNAFVDKCSIKSSKTFENLCEVDIELLLSEKLLTNSIDEDNKAYIYSLSDGTYGVSLTYPEVAIEEVYKQYVKTYGNEPIEPGTREVDIRELYQKELIPERVKTRYLILENGSIERIASE